MEYIVEYWYIVFALIVMAAVAAVVVIRFFNLPTEEQVENVREWLLYAVTETEKELGSGTGQLKLRSAYDMFVVRFPALVKLIPFDMFSELVDEALEEMREMLTRNEAVKKLVCPETEEGESARKVGF